MTGAEPLSVVGVGVDLVEVGRLRAALGRRASMQERLFTPGERDYAARFADPWPRLAARFAAKEAGLKALGLGLGGFRFSEFEVCRRPGGAPVVRVWGQAARAAARAGVLSWQCSLSHTTTLAEAVVVALGRAGGGRP